MEDVDTTMLTNYFKKCFDAILIFTKMLRKYTILDTNNEDIYVFGSGVNYLINGSVKTHRMQDLDILVNNSVAESIISEFIVNMTDDIDIINSNTSDDVNYSSTLLKYQGINKVTKIKFRTMKPLFEFVSKEIINFKCDDIDFSIEEKIKDIFFEDFVFSLDICIYLNKCKYKVVTKYSNTLLTSKKALVNLFYDTKVTYTPYLFDDVRQNKEIIEKRIVKYNFNNYGDIHFYENTVSSLIYQLVLINKIFSENGLRDKDMRIVRKLPKGHCLYKDYNTMKIIFNTNIQYRFVFVKELLSFPPTKNLQKIIGRLELNKDLFIHEWFLLLVRVFGNDCIQSSIMEFSDMKVEDFYSIMNEYELIQVFKRILGHVRTKKIETTCHICMDEYTMNSPLNLCKYGHATHLCCSLKPLNKYLMSALRRFNKPNLPPLEDRQTKSCCVCRSDHYELLVDTETIEFNHTLQANPNMSGITRSGECLMDYGIFKHPMDLYIPNPSKVSGNLFTGNLRNYLNNRYEYLTFGQI